MTTIKPDTSEWRLLHNFTMTRAGDRHHVPGKGKGTIVHVRLDIYADGRVHLSDGANRSLQNEPYNNTHGKAWENVVAALRILYDRAVAESTAHEQEE
jgi:hypothetical protein